MLHFEIAAALLAEPALVTTASDQQNPRPTPQDQTTTNSPSEATTTVSPVTAAASVESAKADHPIEFSLGTSVAEGDFGGSTRTTLWSTALGVRAVVGDVRLTASIPYMRIRSNGVIFTGIDSTPVVVASGAGRKQTNDGWGDVTLGASYTIPHQPESLEVELAGRVKIPTASASSRLSSGKADYSVGVQATKIVGKIAPFVSATYRVLGDTATYDLRDGFAASTGASYIVGRRTVLLGSYHYSRAASRLLPDSHELFLGGSRELAANRLRLTGFGTVGLSNGAAAVSGGVALSFSL